MSDFYPSQLKINLDILAGNAGRLKQTVGVPIMAVIKDDAYGMGAIPMAHLLIDSGISYFAVVNTLEALQLREAGISQPILVFNAFSEEEIAACIENGLTLSLNRFEMIRPIEEACRQTGRSARVHLKIDTGMGRFGVFEQDAAELGRAALAGGCMMIEGVYSHFANIEDNPDDPFNEIQLGRFHMALQTLAEAGIHPQWVHMANSAGSLSCPAARFNMVRMGAGLLGANPFYYAPCPAEIDPALTWSCHLVSVRHMPAGWAIGYGQTYRLNTDAWIGVIPVGYAQGFRRSRKNSVLIRGEELPLIGSVCTDACFVLLPQQFEPGEDVVLLGRQGKSEISIDELAVRWGISRADVTTGISQRVERIYIHGVQ